MSKHKKGGRAAIVIAIVCFVAAAAILIGLFLMQQAANPDPSPNNPDNSETNTDEFPDVDWVYWQSVNPDVIGWVTVPGTNIDSPIVQAHEDDPDYYLHHDVYKNYNVYGCPYLDAGCISLGLEAPNCVIFGHHMNDGTVFSAFASYSEPAFCQRTFSDFVTVT